MQVEKQVEKLGEIHGGGILVTVCAGINRQHSERESALVDYVSSACGSGKTHAYSGHINGTMTARFIVAAKTEELAREIARGIAGAALITTSGLNLRTVRDKQSVTAALSMAVKSYAHRVIVSTAKGLELLARNIYHDQELMASLTDYHVLIDEAPDSRKTVQPFIINASERSMIPWLEHTSTLPDGSMISTNNGKLREALRTGVFRQPDYLVALINGDKVRVKELDGNRIELRTCPRSDLYLVSKHCAGRKVTVFGADIEHSPWMKKGIRNGHISQSQPSDTFKIDPKRMDHRNTSRVKVFNVLDVPKGSKRVIRGRVQSIANAVLSGVRTAGHKEFIWTANHDDQEGVICSEFQRIFEAAMPPVTLADGTRTGAWYVPPMSHGLNQYEDFACAVYLCAVNLSPSAKAELDNDEEVADVEADGHLGACYQFVSRGVIRKRDDESANVRFDCFVLDKAQQDYLIGRFFKDGHKDQSLAIAVESTEQKEAKAQANARAQADRGQRVQSKQAATIRAAIEYLTVIGVKVNKKVVAEHTGLSKPTVLKYWPKCGKVKSAL